MTKFTHLFIGMVFILGITPMVAGAQTTNYSSRITDLQSQLQDILSQLREAQSQQWGTQSGSPGTAPRSANATDTLVTASPSCPSIVRNLSVGTRGSDVASLQKFLTSTGDYTYGVTTGYFGPATQTAVQKWQARSGVVNSGSPATTGYGVFGPSTRARLASQCSGGIYTNELPKQTPPGIYTNELPKQTPPGVNSGRTTSSPANPSTPDANSKVDFEADPISGEAPLKVTFSGSDLIPNLQYIISYGDGANSGPVKASSDGQLADEHEYDSVGTYDASIQVYIACMWGTTYRCMMAAMPIADDVVITVE